MTSERLARLREWTTHAAGSELPFVYSDGVLKLLDEREALLEAAMHVVEAASAGTGPMTAGELRLRDAIVKAES